MNRWVPRRFRPFKVFLLYNMEKKLVEIWADSTEIANIAGKSPRDFESLAPTSELARRLQPHSMDASVEDVAPFRHRVSI